MWSFQGLTVLRLYLLKSEIGFSYFFLNYFGEMHLCFNSAIQQQTYSFFFPPFLAEISSVGLDWLSSEFPPLDSLSPWDDDRLLRPLGTCSHVHSIIHSGFPQCCFPTFSWLSSQIHPRRQYSFVHFFSAFFLSRASDDSPENLQRWQIQP